MSFAAGAIRQEVYVRGARPVALMVQRQGFTNAYSGVSNEQHVSALLGRDGLAQITTPDPASPDTGEVTLTNTDLGARLDPGTPTSAQVLRAVADSDQITTAKFDNVFVGMQHYGYLRRKPEPSGYEARLRVLRSGDTRTMVKGFLKSAEYTLRFGQP